MVGEEKDTVYICEEELEMQALCFNKKSMVFYFVWFLFGFGFLFLWEMGPESSNPLGAEWHQGYHTCTLSTNSLSPPQYLGYYLGL